MNFNNSDEMIQPPTQEYWNDAEEQRYMNYKISKPATEKEWKKTYKFAHKKAFEELEKFENVVQQKIYKHQKFQKARQKSNYKIKYVI